MKTADFHFELPEDLIAERPVARRDSSRLLVMHRNLGIEHRIFSDLPSLLRPGDMLLLNNTRVFPAILKGVKTDGTVLNILLVTENSDGSWNILTRGKYTGQVIINETLSASVSSGRTATFSSNIRDQIWTAGRMPLPPYIRREPDELDLETYQTVYAEIEGSIAAPTAGLHFTPGLLDTLESSGVLLRKLTLHVGVGTFRPVKTSFIEEHQMEHELFEISGQLIAEIENVKKSGGRIIAAGTTTTRALEGYRSGSCRIISSNGTVRGTTNIFIHEGYTPLAVDGLITNFHLPCSTPLMLASVFAGRERLIETYRTAIAMGYRFFSYGDAMLIL